MEFVHWFIDFFLHLDRHLAEIYGGQSWID